MVRDIDHVGIVVCDVEAAIAFYSQSLGVANWQQIELPDHHMVVAIATVGSTLLELIAPTSPEAAFATFLDQRGPGMHHVAYRVNDIEAALTQARANGIQLIDETPRPGIHNTLVAFLHPKSTMGVLTEFVQHLD